MSDIKLDRDKTPILSVKNLKQYFYSGFGPNKNVVKAVDGVSFDIHKGETFGIVGESGCGKTTMGRSIIRLYTPTDGEVYFKGQLISGKLTKKERKEVTRSMQMIFQDPISSLNPRMTVKEIIGEGLRINKLYKDEDHMMELIYNILETVGLTSEHASRYPHEFSGGQRQRIGIARAIITNPDLIIADEPISALDVSIQAQVLNLLNELKDELGLTVMFIAHDLSVVKYFSDKIAVMYNGKIMEMADSDDLYNHPIHPYTQSLLSAIPLADPNFERDRKRIYYEPAIHDYKTEKPELVEIRPNHFVYASPSEVKIYEEKHGVK